MRTGIVLAAILAVAACQGSPSTTPAAAGPRLYVSDETGTEVVVIDPIARTLVQRIAVGKRPRGIRLSRDGRQLYVALSGSPIGGPGVDESKLPPADRAADGIGVIDLASGAVVKKYQSGRDPEAFALSTDGRMLFVSNEDAAEMSALDLESGAVRTRVKVGEEPEGVTVRPDGNVVYVACEGANEVVAIDTGTFEVVAHVKTGARPRGIVFDRNGTTGFVSNENAGAITVFDPVAQKVTETIQVPRKPGSQVPPRPMGLALASDGLRLFVSLGRAKGIAVIDTVKRTVTGTIDDVGARPWGIAISADGR
ncbi:MAG TPA: beta-propeller fold lactonase family protein, partial [Vicinamibacterales bacterium]|nr:beta-propeller fold lactonase family protein [Vicinamibacterales bacterium]